MDENTLLNKNAYAVFDGKSIRDIIIDRLNKNGVFTDQNYQGSNISALIDVVAYSFSTMLFYLNRTSSETMFTESQIYENMNRIVKMINYNPLGKIGQSVPFKMTVLGLLKGNYTIPRYSYLNVGGTNYSFNHDVSFSKTFDSAAESINALDNQYVLNQGIYEENPVYTANGIENEVVFLSVDDTISIDHFNIHVYVKESNSNAWSQWNKVDTLFTNKANDNVFEVRYNENKRYEVKFGDDINGQKLKTGDSVAIYYLRINPDAVEIGVNALVKNKIIRYNTSQFNQILNNVSLDINSVLSNTALSNINLLNDYPSSSYTEEENVDDIRKNAAKIFRSQNRLVTASDYLAFVKTNFKSFLADVQVINNDDFLKTHIKYLYDIGLDNPQLDNRVLYNQVKFANSCNFNNVYVYMVPKNENQLYINPAQKETVINSLQENKVLTSQIVPVDPVYINMDFCVGDNTNTAKVADVSNCKLLIYKKANSKRSSSSIVFDVITFIKDAFNRKKSVLGDSINIYQLSTNILGIDGIDSIKTYRSDTNTYVNGISLLFWNPVYPEQDNKINNQNVKLELFQFPVFNKINTLIDRIGVVESVGSIKVAEF